MRRWLAIHLPDFATERVRLWLRGRRSGGGDDRRGDGRAGAGVEPAVLLVETVAERQLVVRACAASRAVGVRAGMTVTNARALIGAREVHVATYDAGAEAAALERLGHVLDRFSPTVVQRPPDGLLLGLDGLERVLGSEERIVDGVAAFLGSLGFGARLAVADTAAAARGLARCAPEPRTISRPGQVRAALEPLPLAALEVDARTRTALAELELRTVGELLGLSRAQLATRFGPELLEAVDRALGRVDEPLRPLRRTSPPVFERELDGATTDLEVLTLCVGELLDRLCAELREREAGALALVVRLFPTDLPPSQALVLVSRPSRDPAHLMKLVEPRLDSLQLGFGVDRVGVGAPRVGPLTPEQAAGFGLGTDRGPRLDRALGELLDAYAGRFGPRASFSVEAVESPLPERAFRLCPVRAGEDRRPRRARAASLGAAPRPSKLLFEPEPTDVELDPDSGALLGLRWRGEERRVVVARGPERLCRPWWTLPPLDPEATRRSPLERDYYRVQDASGRWLWIFRLDERWFVHGEWA